MSHVFATPWSAVCHASPSFTASQFVQIHVHWVSDAIQPSHPLSPPSLPALNLSQHQGFFQSAIHIRWPKYWSFSFSISPSNEYSGLIYFRIGWFDLLAVQGTLKSLLQHHSSKVSILQWYLLTASSLSQTESIQPHCPHQERIPLVEKTAWNLYQLPAPWNWVLYS